MQLVGGEGSDEDDEILAAAVAVVAPAAAANPGEPENSMGGRQGGRKGMVMVGAAVEVGDWVLQLQVPLVPLNTMPTGLRSTRFCLTTRLCGKARRDPPGWGSGKGAPRMRSWSNCWARNFSFL